MTNAFKEFLISEHNLEPWNFLQSVLSLETLTDVKEKIKKSTEIFNKFIEVGSKEEINISGDTREKLIKTFETQKEKEDIWILKETPKELFNDAFQLVANILRLDTFKRFVRTTKCEEIIKQ